MSVTNPTSPRAHTSARDQTRELLFEIIRSNRAVTRTDLVDATGLSRSTVNNAVTRLVEMGRVSETGIGVKGPGTGSGRAGNVLCAVAAGGHVAGIDFGHTHISVAIGDSLGSVVAETSAPFGVDLQAMEALDTAADLLRSLCAETGIDDVAEVTAGIPGPLDAATGLVCSPTILARWVGLDPAAELQRRLHAHVRTENDAFLGALGERLAGAGRAHTDFLYVKVSDGIGACPVLNGQPYRGSRGIAGELGHTPLPGRSEPCRCGRRGCLEAVVSSAVVREQIRVTHPDDPAALTTALQDLDDPPIRRILDEAGRTLGGVLADLVSLLNPAALILGGELGTAGPSFVAGVRAEVDHRALAASADLEIRSAELGTRAELIGAVMHATASIRR